MTTVGFAVPDSGLWAEQIDRVQAGFGTELRIVRGVDACTAQMAALDVLVANPLDKAYFREAEALKALFVPFVGINHLPIDLLVERGVAVFNCHGNAFSVAERALALALAGLGRLVEYHNDLRSGLWHGFWVGKGKEDFWHSIEGLDCAILGTGAIGQHLARMLKAFNCRVYGFRRQANAQLPEYFDKVGTDLAACLSGADLVFITLPLTEATRRLVDEPVLASIPGAFLVNVGRAEIVEEAALYAALRDGRLAGAGLDVWYQYPPAGEDRGQPSRYPIHELPNVVLSPHVAGSTHRAADQNVRLTVENLVRYLRSGQAMHRVDFAARY